LKLKKIEKSKKKKLLDWDEIPLENANDLSKNDNNTLEIKPKQEAKVKLEKEEEIAKNDSIKDNNDCILKKEENTELNNENQDEWITLDNIGDKLNSKLILDIEDNIKELNISLCTSDFAVQNLALKIGLQVLSIDGVRINQIRNYILKCYSCNTFNFDTSKLFCEFCGYNTLMKIGYSVDHKGNVTIRDKEAEPRLRGTQYNLPKPSLNKKGKVHVLAEDQLPKKKININVEKDLDKLIDNYFIYKDIMVKNNDVKSINSSKNYVWGFPKKKP